MQIMLLSYCIPVFTEAVGRWGWWETQRTKREQCPLNRNGWGMGFQHLKTFQFYSFLVCLQILLSVWSPWSSSLDQMMEHSSVQWAPGEPRNTLGSGERDISGLTSLLLCIPPISEELPCVPWISWPCWWQTAEMRLSISAAPSVRGNPWNCI